MVTWIYDDKSSAEKGISLVSASDVTGYGLEEDVESLPTEGVPNAAKFYVMDYKYLGSTGEWMYMFDAKYKRWLPQ